MVERRTRRTHNQKTATQYQLEQIINDFALDSCFLSDDHGRLLGHAGLWAEKKCSTFVTDVPLIAETGADEHERMYSCEFRAGGQTLYITTVGDTETMRTVAAYRAMFGIRRIRRGPAGSRQLSV